MLCQTRSALIDLVMLGFATSNRSNIAHSSGFKWDKAEVDRSGHISPHSFKSSLVESFKIVVCYMQPLAFPGLTTCFPVCTVHICKQRCKNNPFGIIFTKPTHLSTSNHSVYSRLVNGVFQLEAIFEYDTKPIRTEFI